MGSNTRSRLWLRAFEAVIGGPHWLGAQVCIPLCRFSLLRIGVFSRVVLAVHHHGERRLPLRRRRRVHRHFVLAICTSVGLLGGSVVRGLSN
jgi:hypothetical protein